MTMNAFAQLKATFDVAYAEFQDSPAMRLMRSPEFRPSHYASALREIYFYARENPQLQAAMTLAFRGEQRVAVKRVMGHALAEVGHDQMALEDLEAMGIDTSSIPDGNPLHSTIPLTAYPLYLLYHHCPVAYLGQIFFLEFLPTESGEAILQVLESAGVPGNATSFLAEHAEVDVKHNRLMERHAADLLKSERDIREACRAIRVCAHNYAQMLNGAFEAASRFAAVDRPVIAEVV